MQRSNTHKRNETHSEWLSWCDVLYMYAFVSLQEREWNAVISSHGWRTAEGENRESGQTADLSPKEHSAHGGLRRGLAAGGDTGGGCCWKSSRGGQEESAGVIGWEEGGRAEENRKDAERGVRGEGGGVKGGARWRREEGERWWEKGKVRCMWERTLK